MFQVEISRVLEIVHFFRYKKKVFKLKLPEERAGRTVCLVYGSHLHVQCTSRAVGVREMSCTSHVTQYPSHGTVHASRTSSKLVNEDPDGEVNLPEAEYAMDVVALGTMRARCVTTGLPCWCKALRLRVRTRRAALCAGTCRRFTLQQAVWSSGPFSSQVYGSGSHVDALPFIT